MRRARALRVCLALIVLCGGVSSVRGDDAAWEARLLREVAGLEARLQVIDRAKSVEGALWERVAALDARVAALEQRAGLPEGKVSGKRDLPSLTTDVTQLGTRFQAAVAPKPKREPAPPSPPRVVPPAEADGDDPAAEKPKVPPTPGGKPGPREWPKQVEFKATAKAVYEETGAWWDDPDGLWPNDFLMDGYRVRLSFTLAAANLVRDVRSVVVRVAVRLSSPLADGPDALRVYEVEWAASGTAFGNDSIRRFPKRDEFMVPARSRWISGPAERVARPEAKAYLVSALLSDGKTLTFEAPEPGGK